MTASRGEMSFVMRWMRKLKAKKKLYAINNLDFNWRKRKISDAEDFDKKKTLCIKWKSVVQYDGH